MLPTMFLQANDFTSFDTEFSSLKLLPPGATEPQVAFADLLKIGVDSRQQADIANGQVLPHIGNELPLEAPIEREIPIADSVIDLSVNLSVNEVPPAPAVPLLATTTVFETVRAEPVTPSVWPALARPSTPAEALNAEIVPNRHAALRSVAPMNTSSQATDIIAARQAQDGPVTRQFAAPVAETLSARTVPEQQVAPIHRQLPAMPVVANPDNRLTDIQKRMAENPAPARESTQEMPRSFDPVATMRAKSGAAHLPSNLNPRPDMQPGIRLRTQTITSPAAPPATHIVQPQTVTITPMDAPLMQPGALQLAEAPTRTILDTPAPTLQASQTIDVPVRDAAWGDQVGQRIQLMASNKLQSAEIRLTPAELGPLRVRVSVDDGAAAVSFHAQHAVTRDAIEQALPRLRELLAENGLTLSQTSIGEQEPQHGGRGRGDDASRINHRTTTDERVDEESPPKRQHVADGLVDTFA